MAEHPIKRCRLFRFRLRTLLLLPVVFAAAWWWITWPERTARRFVELLSAGDIEAAQAMFDGPLLNEFRSRDSGKRRSHGPLRMRTEGWSPALFGRRKFITELSPEREFHFIATRGRVAFDQLTMTYDVKRVSASELSLLLTVIYAEREDLLIVASEEKRQIVVTVPEDDLTPPESLRNHLRGQLESSIHVGPYPQWQSVEQMQQNIGNAIALLDTPNSGVDELSADDLTIVRPGRSAPLVRE